MTELIAWPDLPAFGWSIAEEQLHRCARCGARKAQTDFHNSRSGEFTYCRDCRNAYDRQYYAERGRAARRERARSRDQRAQAWMNSLKDGVPCADCGEVFPAPLMHWDHLPGYAKLGAISSIMRRKRTSVFDELKKCQLVCANCHAIRTARRRRRQQA